MAFKIGQKVVCVNDSPGWLDTLNGSLERGRIYTIRGLPEVNGTVGVWLEEVVNDVVWFAEGPSEPRYRPERFRPIVERKTDTGMAILREILERESYQDRAPSKVQP